MFTDWEKESHGGRDVEDTEERKGEKTDQDIGEGNTGCKGRGISL